MRRMTLFLALLVIAGGVAQAQTDMDLVINARPAALLIDMDGKKFATTDADGRRVSLSNVYTMPNIAAGVGIDIKDFYLDITGGAGVLINDNFRSYMLEASAALNMPLSESCMLGPRAGVVYFVDPEWTENDDVDFDDTAGFLLGLQLTMGDKIQYLVSVDVLDMSMDADVAANVIPEDDELDFTGLAIQFGVRGEF